MADKVVEDRVKPQRSVEELARGTAPARGTASPETIRASMPFEMQRNFTWLIIQKNNFWNTMINIACSANVQPVMVNGHTESILMGRSWAVGL